MMRSNRLFQSLFVFLAVAGLAGCASSGGSASGGAAPSGDGIAIQVTNDVVPPTDIIVWVVPEVGTRRRLGPIPPNGRRSFSYSPMQRSSQIYLLAVPEGPASGTMGQPSERRSTLFSLVDVQSVAWTVTRPNVQIGS